jgi:calcineurin-like phosphoesterase
MTGSYSGVIGMEKSQIIERFTKVPAPRAEHSKGDVWICAVVIEVDEATGMATRIERLKIEHSFN